MKNSLYLLAPFWLATPAAAQMNAPLSPPMMNLMPSLAGYDPVSIALQKREAITRSLQARSAVSEGATSAELVFTPSAAARRSNYGKFVERSRRTDPGGAASLAATLQTDPIASMAPELAKVGLRTNNVADAYAVYWVEAWQGAHGTALSTDRGMAQAVKQQAANALLSTPEFLEATDAQKREFADALLVQALLIGAAREQNKGNPAMLRQIAAAVRQGARASGLNLDAMTLTPQGFVPSDGASATERALAPGEAPRSVAATEASTNDPYYALIAVAGGAGLGAAFLLGKARGRKG